MVHLVLLLLPLVLLLVALILSVSFIRLRRLEREAHALWDEIVCRITA